MLFICLSQLLSRAGICGRPKAVTLLSNFRYSMRGECPSSATVSQDQRPRSVKQRPSLIRYSHYLIQVSYMFYQFEAYCDQ
jgi:hypothetical protein